MKKQILVIFLISCFLFFANGETLVSNMNESETTPQVIEFPLHGEWITPNSPGTRVPSHGTKMFGEEYAIDFVMIKDGHKKAYSKSTTEYILSGIDLVYFYGWGQDVFAPLSGEVIACVNNIEERNKVNIFNDYTYMKKVTKEFLAGNGSIESITGNYVMIKKSDKVYVLLAHLKTGSVCVKLGQKVTTNQKIGELGHSGNSMMPHLHMQLMNNSDYKIAKGINFAFREYERKVGNDWIIVNNSVPKSNEIIRHK